MRRSRRAEAAKRHKQEEIAEPEQAEAEEAEEAEAEKEITTKEMAVEAAETASLRTARATRNVGTSLLFASLSGELKPSEPEIYGRFVSALQRYDDRQVDALELISIVTEIFSAHQRLLAEFCKAVHANEKEPEGLKFCKPVRANEKEPEGLGAMHLLVQESKCSVCLEEPVDPVCLPCIHVRTISSCFNCSLTSSFFWHVRSFAGYAFRRFTTCRIVSTIRIMMRSTAA
jgi:hypothetical protein